MTLQFAVLFQLQWALLRGFKHKQGLTGCALPRLLDAYDEHQALLKEQETLKRRAENGYGLSPAALGRAGQLWGQGREQPHPGGFLSLPVEVFVSFEPTDVGIESVNVSPLKCILNRAVLL